MVQAFVTYDEGELERAGSAFVAAAATLFEEPWGPVAWTDLVLDWFAAASGAGRSVWARQSSVARPWRAHSSLGRLEPRNVTSEWIVDLCHTSYPVRDPADRVYWKRALAA